MASNFTEIASFTWSVADLLRGDYKQSDYGKVILPFTLLRRMDCVLEATKPAVLKEVDARKDQGIDLKTFLTKKAAQSFYNTSPFDFTKLQGDALMKTRGIVSNLCFIEIKTHSTSLLSNKPYRAGCWAPSDELAGAVAQVQGTVHSAVETIGNKLTMKDENGAATGEEAFNYQPRSFLVIGSLSEFVDENGVNSDKYRSFELYRKNTVWPEIITFDELYERARYVVNHNG
ncbi:MAG: Shedu anti-phage system protein SduA domain-containing protein [Pseudomonadota bacterium]